MQPVPLVGGKSVYCINESQRDQARRLADEDPESAPRIRTALDQVEQRLNRNERAALAFLLIDRLMTS